MTYTKEQLKAAAKLVIDVGTRLRQDHLCGRSSQPGTDVLADELAKWMEANPPAGHPTKQYRQVNVGDLLSLDAPVFVDLDGEMVKAKAYGVYKSQGNDTTFVHLLVDNSPHKPTFRTMASELVYVEVSPSELQPKEPTTKRPVKWRLGPYAVGGRGTYYTLSSVDGALVATTGSKSSAEFLAHAPAMYDMLRSLLFGTQDEDILKRARELVTQIADIGY